jgi:hypothetical protein
VDSLKLGIAGLPMAETNLIATLFRLHRVERSFIWTLRYTPPFDALLVDASLTTESIQPLCGPNTSVMRLSPQGEPAQGEMPRPIRSDRLVSWLNSIEVGLLHGGHDAFASTAGHSGPATESHDTVAARATTPSIDLIPKPPIDTSDASLLFKLKRWPPAEAMAQDVGRIRIATVLSRKSISLQELTSLSRIERSHCEAFLQTLSKNNLISIGRRPHSSSKSAVTAGFMASHAAKKKDDRGGRLSLIFSIRRRFGLI